MSKSYRVALIGCGRISFKHIEGFLHNAQRLEFVAAVDPRLERAEEKLAEYRKSRPTNARAFADYRQMLTETKPDIVTVATESGFHAEIVIACLKAGANVVVEKPMALSTQDAQAMIDSAAKANRKLSVCFQNRFNAPIQKTYDALSKGRFGRMMHGQVQVRWNRNEGYYAEAPWRGTWELDGGTLMNQCTHGIDLLQWLIDDEVVKVHAVTRRYLRPIEAEDFGAAILEFKNGAVGIIEGTADVYPRNLNETLSLFGEKGTVVIGGLAVNKIETWRFADAAQVGDTEDKVLNPNEKDPPTVYGFGHNALFADFVDAIDHDREPFVSGERGKKALDIILAIYRSQKTGLPVELPHQFSTLQMKGEFDA